MTRSYTCIIPVRFTEVQLAQVDELASRLRTRRSTLIRETTLETVCGGTAKDGNRGVTSLAIADPLLLTVDEKADPVFH